MGRTYEGLFKETVEVALKEAQPDKLYGAIYDLAYEISGSANKSELNLFIASQMKKVRDVKMYDVTANGGLTKPEKEPERPQRKRGMRL